MSGSNLMINMCRGKQISERPVISHHVHKVPQMSVVRREAGDKQETGSKVTNAS